MLVAETNLQKKLVNEAPRGTIFAIFIGKPVESNFNHNSSNLGKPVAKQQILQTKPLNMKVHMRNR